MKITVFTPAYNRGYIIEKLYESLKRQTFRDFEWLVMDDGSTDNTEEVFSDFLKDEHFFPIRYYRVENGGKHRAINKGVQLAEGELFFTVDSDDYLPDDALELIAREEKKIQCKGEQPEKNKIAAIFGLRCHQDGSVIGSTFAGEYIDISTLTTHKYGIRGDKGEVFYTAILRHYPYPEFDDEKFCTEAIVWDRISRDGYLYRYINKWLTTCEYLEDGLTHQGWKLYAQNPKQWGLSIGQNYRFGKYGWYSTSVQIYVYYRYEKEQHSIRQMSQMSGLSIGQIVFSVSLQQVLDRIRGILGKPQVKTQY